MTEEQISPELVLVDPELADRARREMPLAGADVPWAEASPPAAVPPSAPPARQRQGFPALATLWLFAGLAVAVTLALELLPDRQPRPTLAAAPARPAQRPETKPPPAAPKPKPKSAAPRRTAPPPPAAAAKPPPPPPAPKPPPPPPAPKPKPKPKPKPPPPPAAARPQPAPEPAPRQSTVPRRPPPPPAPVPGTAAPPPPAPTKPPPPRPGFRPARVFAWAPHKGASYYHVVIRKDGRVHFEAWPHEARLTVPGRVTFTPGDYTWRVWPGIGPRSAKKLGPPIVDSSFTLRG